MTLLTVCANAMSNIGVGDTTPLTSIIGSQLPNAIRIFQMARRAAESIALRANWTALVVEHVFTAEGMTSFTLPSDFRSMINDTLWDRSRYWALRGALSPQQWQLYKSSIIGTATIEQRWRIRIGGGPVYLTDDHGNILLDDKGFALTTGATTSNLGPPNAAQFFIDPTIGASDNSTFVFEYVSKNWCMSANGTPQSQWQADSDVFLIDENLLELGIVWRMLRRLGLSYSEEREEYEREVDKAVARDGGTATISMVPNPRLILVGPFNIPETGYGH